MNDDDRAFCGRVAQLGSPAMCHNTHELTELVMDEGVTGDFAEAGVYGGSHPAIMARVLMQRGAAGRKVHLFDSFEGVPKCTTRESPHDQERYGKVAGGVLESSGLVVCTRRGVNANMVGWGIDPSLLVYHEGWFQATLAPGKDPGVGQLAFLRIDVDLYDSTLPVLRALYPLVAHGGVVCSDDLANPRCRKATEEVIEHELGETWSPAHVDAGTYWWRRP